MEPQDNSPEVHKFNSVPGINANAESIPVKVRRSPSAKRAENRAKKEQQRGFPLPLELVCMVSGEKVKYTSLTYIRRLIAKYGSIEELRAKYVSVKVKKTQLEKDK